MTRHSMETTWYHASCLKARHWGSEARGERDMPDHHSSSHSSEGWARAWDVGRGTGGVEGSLERAQGEENMGVILGWADGEVRRR